MTPIEFGSPGERGEDLPSFWQPFSGSQASRDRLARLVSVDGDDRRCSGVSVAAREFWSGKKFLSETRRYLAMPTSEGRDSLFQYSGWCPRLERGEAAPLLLIPDSLSAQTDYLTLLGLTRDARNESLFYLWLEVEIRDKSEKVGQKVFTYDYFVSPKLRRAFGLDVSEDQRPVASFPDQEEGETVSLFPTNWSCLPQPLGGLYSVRYRYDSGQEDEWKLCLFNRLAQDGLFTAYGSGEVKLV